MGCMAKLEEMKLTEVSVLGCIREKERPLVRFWVTEYVVFTTYMKAGITEILMQNVWRATMFVCLFAVF